MPKSTEQSYDPKAGDLVITHNTICLLISNISVYSSHFYADCIRHNVDEKIAARYTRMPINFMFVMRTFVAE